MDISQKIKKIREENNLSQEKFAEAIGVSRQSIISYEKGKSVPQMDILLIICTKFQKDLNYFLENTLDSKEAVDDIPTVKNEIVFKPLIRFEALDLKREFIQTKKKFDIKVSKIKIYVMLILIVLNLVLMLFISFLFLLGFIPIVFLLFKFLKNYFNDIYFKVFKNKYDYVIKKYEYPLSPLFSVNMTFDNGINVYYNEELHFHCDISDFDHYEIYINDRHVGKNLPIHNDILDYRYSIAIYLKGNGNPYMISFPLIYNIKYIDEEMWFAFGVLSNKLINECAMQLKLIEEKK